MLSRDERDIPTVFTVELSTGVQILVHPIYDKKRCFLPCTYAYATTIRRAQGATYRHGCLWFDHCHPPERGYGYVGASRFKSKDGIYLFGKVRRTDWLPVRETAKAMEQDQVDRSEESMDEYDSEEEEAMVRPRDYDGGGDYSVSGDSDDSFVRYEEARDKWFEDYGEERAWADYNFEFSKPIGRGGLPDLSSNFV